MFIHILIDDVDSEKCNVKEKVRINIDQTIASYFHKVELNISMLFG